MVSSLLFNWFISNEPEDNASKCLVLVSTDKLVGIKIGGEIIQNSAYEKLLSLTIDSKLNFYKHITQLCGKAREKLKALARISQNISRGKRRKFLV